MSLDSSVVSSDSSQIIFKKRSNAGKRKISSILNDEKTEESEEISLNPDEARLLQSIRHKIYSNSLRVSGSTSEVNEKEKLPTGAANLLADQLQEYVKTNFNRIMGKEEKNLTEKPTEVSDSFQSMLSSLSSVDSSLILRQPRSSDEGNLGAGWTLGLTEVELGDSIKKENEERTIQAIKEKTQIVLTLILVDVTTIKNRPSK